MARLKAAGHHLLPLGGGADGKAPLLRAWAGPGLTLGRVLAPMYRAGSAVYGVRLDGLAVIDCDDDDCALVSQMEARFGKSPVHVKTPRGRHLYYLSGGVVPNLRGEGLPVDIKTGPRSYVVGPLSHRPDGGFYDPVKGLLGKETLMPLRVSASPVTAPILTGHRHVELVKEAMRMVEMVNDAGELQANLAGIRDDWCVDPATMPDSELAGIAGWAWKCRLENRIYRGRDSAFPMQRRAVDALRSQANGADAIALLVLLEDQHGHKPGKRFPLDFDAMRKAGLLNLSKPRLRAARRTLEGAGLLRLVGRHRAGSKPQTFALTRAQSRMDGVANVEAMPKAHRGGVPGK
ncbi:MAG: bifunctional DNA primase/polymerase [Sulfitobacter sp.]